MSRINTLKLTREKRKSQSCKTYQVKVDKSKLKKSTLKQLNSLFLEGKWLYNNILSTKDIKNYNTKIKSVSIKVKDIFENRNLKNISSQMKQSIKDRTFQSILSLSAKKKQGYKVGKLKFISNLKCIPLPQHNNTYKVIKASNRIKLQGIKQKLKVYGLEQLPDNCEIANANLVKKCNNFYFYITTYVDKETKDIPNESIGIDFGCETQMTLSNSIKIEFQIPVSTQLKKLDRKIMKKKRPRSNNKYKDQQQREKLYQDLTNKKKDIKDKIVSCLTNYYKYVIFQDESIHAWHSGNHGKKIQNSGIGGIISDLKHKSHTPIMVDKFFPSTQLCPDCGKKNKIPLYERIYSCECGYIEDRDVKSAICIEKEGLKSLVPAERRDVKPREMSTSVDNIFNSLKRIKNISVSICQNPQLIFN